jgi:hypothetical protein
MGKRFSGAITSLTTYRYRGAKTYALSNVREEKARGVWRRSLHREITAAARETRDVLDRASWEVAVAGECGGGSISRTLGGSDGHG